MEIIIGIIALVGIVYFIQNKKDKGSSVSKPTPAPQPKKPSVAELKKLTKNQLIEMADKKNLKVKKSGSKAAVISELREQL